MNARISVNEHVLIPRIETEQLVEIILDQHPAGETFSVVDIGTGSGCIPIALKMERPQWQLYGIDISTNALEVAKKNAEQNEVSVSFTKGDILSSETINIKSPLEIIVSNPPYITPEEIDLLEPQVKDYEPSEALFFDNIEKMYQSIIDFSDKNLSEDGMLYLELHENYSEQILALFDHNLWSAHIEKDYDEKPRFIIAQKQ